MGMHRRLRKPVLTVLKWQLLTTMALALVSAFVSGRHGTVSALAGGAISMAAGLAAALVASLGNARSAASALGSALRAEAGERSPWVALPLLGLADSTAFEG